MSESSTKRAVTWSGAHKHEATARGFELMGERCRASSFAAVHGMFTGCAVAGDRESGWRKWLARAGFDSARIDREVRRVDGLATGRLVRETRIVWRIVDATDGCHVTMWEGKQRPDHGEARDPWIIVKVRVTRIRRAA